MTDELLALASAGLHPDRVRSLIGTHGLAGTVEAIRRGRIEVNDRARREVNRAAEQHRVHLRDLGVEFVPRTSARFPDGLGQLPDAPRWLFVRGILPQVPGVAIIGSRRATRYGLGIARALGTMVGSAGWPVVSGLAAGVDGAAHRGSLDGGGVGVAVLGSGIDVWYPTRNRGLGEDVLAAGGAVVSEFPPGTPPDSWRFPCRNRIISGLAEVVIVVEAATRSGALITARLALEQGREVLAVPGDIDRETSAGTNLLIRDGAFPLTELTEVVETLELMMGPAPRQLAATAEGDPILDLIGPAGTSVEELAAAAGMPIADALAVLARLEIEGRVRLESGRVVTTSV